MARPKLTRNIVFVGLLLTTFGGVWIADHVQDRRERAPIVQHVKAPPTATSTVTVQRPGE